MARVSPGSRVAAAAHATTVLRACPHRDAIARVLATAIDAVDPRRLAATVVRIHARGLAIGDRVLPLRPGSRVHVVGAGKATLAMAEGLLDALGERIDGGCIAVKRGTGAPARVGPIEVIEAGHPLPDEISARAGARILEIARNAEPDDVLVCAISGGASALMVAPVPPLDLVELRERTRALLVGGAAIDEINTVRACGDAIKRGGLARATAARIVSLLVSDVPAGRLDLLGSGPTVPAPDPSRAIELVLADDRTAAAAAMERARAEGFVVVDAPALLGDARAAGIALAARLRELAGGERPALAVTTGETTVTVTGGGVGGRNLELALAAVEPIVGIHDVLLLALATDGDDGPSGAAGAIVSGESAARARALGLDAAAHLRDSDSLRFFAALGDAITSGPTGTNVRDLALVCAW
jgi:hydroxypyruvate reductase